MTLELRYILVSSNYVQKLRYKMVIIQLCLFVTKKRQKNTQLLRNLLAGWLLLNELLFSDHLRKEISFHFARNEK